MQGTGEGTGLAPFRQFAELPVTSDSRIGLRTRSYGARSGSGHRPSMPTERGSHRAVRNAGTIGGCRNSPGRMCS